MVPRWVFGPPIRCENRLRRNPDFQSALPDAPTMAEAGLPQIGFDPDIWHGVVVPLGTPEFIIRSLNAVANDCLRSPEVKDTFEKLTFDPIIDTPEGFAHFLAIQAEK